MADESRGQGPDAAPGAEKEEIATDLSEVARQRLSGTDKTDTGGSIEADAKDLAEGVAGKPADDDTAAAVETSPTAAVTESHPGPKAGTEQGPDRPTPTAPAPPAQEGSRTTPETTTAGGSGTAPAERAPAGTGAPTRPAQAEATTPTPEPASAPSGGATPQGGAPAAEAETGGTPARPPGAVRPAAGARPPGGPGGRPAAPAAPPKPPEPEPEELPAFKEIVPDLAWERRHGYVELKVPSDKLVAMAERVKALGYDYLSAVTAVDWRDRVEMLYHLYAYDYVAKPGCIVLRADLPPEPNPLCPSLTPIWPGAEFQEREVYDLFGVKFVGHPDLRRILTEDRFPGHPLRKDWTFDYQYVLVKHLRYGVEQQHEPPGGQEGYRSV